MSASFLVGTSNLSSQRTIPRAQRVGNGRLQDRSAGERASGPHHEEKPPAPVGAANGSSEDPGYHPPETAESLEELFLAQEEAKACKQSVGSKEEPPYTAPKRRKPQIDVLA